MRLQREDTAERGTITEEHDFHADSVHIVRAPKYHIVWNALPVLLSVVSYSNSLHGELFFDDKYAVIRNGDVVNPGANSIADIFTHDYWGMPISNPASHKSYRPLIVLTFRWNHIMHGAESFGYHVVNVICHSLASWLVLRCALLVFTKHAENTNQIRNRTPFSPWLASILASAMFSLHPIHTEAVSGVVGRAELMCCCFFLISFVFGVKSTRGGCTGWLFSCASCFSMIAAVLCKETGITVMGCIFTFDLTTHLQHIAMRRPDKKTWASFAVRQLFYVLFSVAFLKWRIDLNAGTMPSWPQKDNPAQTGNFSLKLMNYPYIYAYNAMLLLVPWQLCGDYSYESIPSLESWLDARNGITAVFIISLLALVATALPCKCKSSIKSGDQHVVHKRSNDKNGKDYCFNTKGNHPSGQEFRLRAITQYEDGSACMTCECISVRLDILMGLSFLIFPFLPSSNIFFPVGFLVAERILYIPSIGYCLIFGGFAARWIDRVSTSQNSNPNLRTSSMPRRIKVRLASSTLLLAIFGVRTLWRNIDWRNEENFWKSVIRVVPRNSKGHFNYGNVMFSKNELKESIKYFKKSLEITPEDPSTLVNMATSYYKLNRHDDAIAAYEEASKYARGFGQYFNWGYIYEQRNNYDMAIKIFDMASQYDSRTGRMALYQDDPFAKAVCAVHLGTLLCRQHRSDEGLRAFYRAVSIDPSVQEAWIRMGLEHAVRPGEMDRAVYALDRAVILDPSSRGQIAGYLKQQGNEVVAERYIGTKDISPTRAPPGMEFYGDSPHDTRHVYSSAELFSSGAEALNVDLQYKAPKKDTHSDRAKFGKKRKRKQKRRKRKKATVPRDKGRVEVAHEYRPVKSSDGGMASDHMKPPPPVKSEDMYVDDDW